MKYWFFFAIYKINLYPLGVQMHFGSVLVWLIFCVILCFGDFFCFCGSVFLSLVFCFQRLEFEGMNGFCLIWLITVISHIPLILADHCISSKFWLQLWLTAGAGFFVKTAKNGFGSPF